MLMKSNTDNKSISGVGDVAIVEQLRDYFSNHHDGLLCVYLFGSTARGKAHRGSDVDVAVLYTKEPPATLDGLGLDLSSELEDCLRKPVDLVVLNRASPDLIHRILRDKIIVYEGQRSARINFEVKARNEYFDILPYLREYRRRAGELRR
jgi:predicted nucleotidyltransferase